MSGLERQNAKIFAETAPQRQVTKFRTTGTNNPETSKTPNEIQNEYYSAGWLNSDNTGNVIPYAEDMNAVQFVQSYNTAYLFEKGIPEYSSTQTYYTNSFCSYNGTVYKCLADNTLNVLPTNTTAWTPYGISSVQIENIGTSGASVYAGESEGVHQFKKINVTGSATTTETDDTITIDVVGGTGGANFSVQSPLEKTNTDPAVVSIKKSDNVTSGYLSYSDWNTFNSKQAQITSTNKLSASLVSGLASVATSGSYSSLSGVPTNISSFTNDAGYLTEETAEYLPLSGGTVTGNLTVENNGWLTVNRIIDDTKYFERLFVNSNGVGAIYNNKGIIINAGEAGSVWSGHSISMHIAEQERFSFSEAGANFYRPLFIDANTAESVKITRHFYSPDLKWTNWFRMGVNASQQAQIYSETMSVVITAKGNNYSFGDGTGGVISGSDERLKKNVISMPDGALDILKRVRPVKFDFITEESSSSYHAGFIAQETDTITPDLTVPPSTEDGYYGIDYAGFVPYLVKAVQELSAKVDELEAKLSKGL